MISSTAYHSVGCFSIQFSSVFIFTLPVWHTTAIKFIKRVHVHFVGHWDWPNHAMYYKALWTNSNCFHINKCLFKYYKWNEHNVAPPTRHDYAYVACVEIGMMIYRRVYETHVRQHTKTRRRSKQRPNRFDRIKCCDSVLVRTNERRSHTNNSHTNTLTLRFNAVSTETIETSVGVRTTGLFCVSNALSRTPTRVLFVLR